MLVLGSLFILGMVTVLPFVLAIWALATLRSRRDWFSALSRGAGWVAAWALLGVVFQAWWVFGSGQASYSVDVSGFLGGASIAWWVQMGGHSVQTVFEETVLTLRGRRQTTMLSNWPYYYGLVIAQTALLAAIVAWRLRRGRSLRDPLVLLVAAFVVVNAWLGRNWPWWGS
ncbi:MAG: hypothetical protein ACYTG6_00520 [Planctomycetota bacterium]|jgi:hypothetical protein